jgi:hypothetical protein
MQVPIGQLIQISSVIPISTTTSAAMPTEGAALVGVMMPAAFTGTAITFLVCNTLAGTYVPLKNASGAVSYTVAAAEYVAVNPADFYGVTFFQIVSNATELAARTLVCSMKGI